MTTAPKPSPPSPPLLSPEALARTRSLYVREQKLWARAMVLAPFHVDAARMAAELEQDLAQQLREYPQLADGAK